MSKDEGIRLLSGGRIHFARSGSGKSVILLHGILASSCIWKKVIYDLEHSFDTVAPDLPGHGDSARLAPGKCTREELRHFLKEFMDALGIPAATLVGHSWGGGIAIDMALHHPERVEKLVLIDSTGYSGGSRLAEWLLTHGGILTPVVHLLGRRLLYLALARSVFFDRTRVTGDIVEAWLRSIRASLGTLKRIGEYEMLMEQDIPHITQPTLIIWGEADRLIPVEFAERFRQEIKLSVLRVINLCGHNPPEEKPDEVNAAIRSFLQEK